MLYNINNTLSITIILYGGMMPDHISLLLPDLPGLDVLPDDEVVQLHLLLHQGEVGGWPVTDCGGQESPDIRLSPQLSPAETAVCLTEVLGEE